ncbi:glutamine synthetase [Chromatiales bacterium (ex Bugula neritina AB1)]|nr:glutamine synthetase [Chromatiales bacterium (ex Bugula neritina AB1)]
MNIEDYLSDSTSRFATVAMTDTNGLLRGQMVAVRHLQGILQNGMGMAPAQLALDPTDEMLMLPGVTDENGDFHDGLLSVDTGSARSLPWASSGHNLLLLARFADETAQFCPRAMLEKTLERATEAGIIPRYGLELEYTLFDETEQTAQAKGFRNLKTATPHKSHDLLTYQVAQQEWYEAVSAMCDSLDIQLSKMHEEIGGGFMEACIDAGTGISPADQTVLLKNFLRILAMRQERTVTFMPRWSEQADSQSMHLHMSLLDTDQNPLFYNAAEANSISETFRYFIGGLQKNVADLSLMFLPTVNSYRRFAPGTFAPPALTWGVENRTTCFRVVGHSPESMRVENRLAGADANPYFNVAATLAAGLDGIENKIEPQAAVTGSGYEQQAGPRYTSSMPEAISRLRESEFAHDWFGERFITAFSTSRESQYDAFCAKVPDVELERFFSLG